MENVDKKLEIINKFYSIMMSSKFVLKLANNLEYNGLQGTFLYKGKSIFDAPLDIKEMIVNKSTQDIKNNFKNNTAYTLYRMKLSGLNLRPLFGVEYP